LNVVVISLIAVASWRAPAACCAAEASSSVEDDCTCPTAVPICRPSARVSTTASVRATSAVAADMTMTNWMLRVVSVVARRVASASRCSSVAVNVPIARSMVSRRAAGPSSNARTTVWLSAPDCLSAMTSSSAR
jgi:hypothetical protein